MDRAAAGLEPDPCPDVHLLCRAYARVTPPGPDAKGKMNGSAALDIRPHRRYVVEKAAARQACCRRKSSLLYSHFKWSLHRIRDGPKKVGENRHIDSSHRFFLNLDVLKVYFATDL